MYGIASQIAFNAGGINAFALPFLSVVTLAIRLSALLLSRNNLKHFILQVAKFFFLFSANFQIRILHAVIVIEIIELNNSFATTESSCADDRASKKHSMNSNNSNKIFIFLSLFHVVQLLFPELE